MAIDGKPMSPKEITRWARSDVPSREGGRVRLTVECRDGTERAVLCVHEGTERPAFVQTWLTMSHLTDLKQHVRLPSVFRAHFP